MTTKHRDPPPTYIAWVRSNVMRDEYGKLHREWTELEEKAAYEHRKANPLTSPQRNLILAHYDGGGAICCTAGREFLDSPDLGLDPCWAEYINMTYYNCGGCTPEYHKGGRSYAEGRVKLIKILDNKINAPEG